jgi:uracil-DNA glycosylase
MKILFVGSNPSTASPTSDPFNNATSSSRILTEWVKDLEGDKVHINVSNEKTEGNRPLKQSEIKASLGRLAEDISRIAPARIVALGKTATRALTLLQVPFFEMPHPSGMNRLLNDPKYVEEKIKRLTEFLSPVSPEVI